MKCNAQLSLIVTYSSLSRKDINVSKTMHSEIKILDGGQSLLLLRIYTCPNSFKYLVDNGIFVFGTKKTNRKQNREIELCTHYELLRVTYTFI